MGFGRQSDIGTYIKHKRDTKRENKNNNGIKKLSIVVKKEIMSLLMARRSKSETE